MTWPEAFFGASVVALIAWALWIFYKAGGEDRG